MLSQSAHRVLSLLLVGTCLLIVVVVTSQRANKELVVSDWCKKDVQLCMNIVETLDEFIAEPRKEKARGAAVIESYYAWHNFWLQPEIYDLEMTFTDDKLMKESALRLCAAHARYRKEVRRRVADQGFAGNEKIYDKIHKLQTTNPLADK